MQNIILNPFPSADGQRITDEVSQCLKFCAIFSDSGLAKIAKRNDSLRKPLKTPNQKKRISNNLE